MSVVLGKKNLGSRFVEISLGKGGQFELEMRTPSYDELIADAQQDADECLAARLDALVIGWRGVDGEDGKPIPFSQDAFRSLCREFPQVIFAAGAAANLYFNGITDDQKKTSSVPPEGSLPEAPAGADAPQKTLEPLSGGIESAS